MTRKLLFAQFAVVAALAVLHIVALEYALYWKYPWFDILTHFLGGIWAALFFYWIAAITHGKSNILLAIGGALLLGLMWEIFEFVSGISLAPNYVPDTLLDILMDVVGATLASVFVKVTSLDRI